MALSITDQTGHLLEREKQVQLYNGNSITSEFSGAIARMDEGILQPGDILCIPEDFTNRIVDIHYPDGNVAQCLLVETTDGHVRRLFPSQLSRRVRVDSERIISANGSAVDLYMNYVSVQDGMNALRGRKVRVSNIEYVRCCVTGRIRPVHTFNLV